MAQFRSGSTLFPATTDVADHPTLLMERVTSRLPVVTRVLPTPQERDTLRAMWQVEVRTLPSYAERYQTLREQVQDGLLTEAEQERIETHRQVYQCAYPEFRTYQPTSAFEAYYIGLLTVDEMVRIARRSAV